MTLVIAASPLIATATSVALAPARFTARRMGQLYQLDRRRRYIEAQQGLSFLAEKHVFSLLSR
jgi:hypothetical protein